MTDLLHNRELVVLWPSVMTSFYSAMKCCTVGSWKSGSASTCISVSLNVKYRQIRDRSVLIIRLAMEDSVSWFCAVKKWICFFLGQRWKSLLANSRPRSVYKNNVFSPPLLRIFAKVFESRIACFVLQRLSLCKVWKLFNDNQHERVTVVEHFRIWQVIKSACHWSSTPLTTVRRRWKLRRTRRCKGCRDAQTVSGECVQLSPNLWRCVQLFLKRRDKVRAV